MTARSCAAISILLGWLWRKRLRPDSIYADFTWVAFAGDKAREHATNFQDRRRCARRCGGPRASGALQPVKPVSGREADSGGALGNRGGPVFGDAFVASHGPSISDVSACTGAPNLDSLETLDDRTLIDNTCFFSRAVEIYIRWKIRRAQRTRACTIENGHALVSGEARQREI